MTKPNRQRSTPAQPGTLLKVCILAAMAFACLLLAIGGHGFAAFCLFAFCLGALGATVEPFDTLDD